MALVLWLLVDVVVIAGIVPLIRGQILSGTARIGCGLPVGPGDVSAFS